MAYELQGRLFEIFDTQQITDTFKKENLWSKQQAACIMNT